MKHLVILALTALAVVAFWWMYIRSAAPTFHPRITWDHRAPGIYAVAYITRSGLPVSDLRVGFELDSGHVLQRVTDSAGEATAAPNHSHPEIVALHVDHRRIALRPPPFRKFRLPSCLPYGVTFHVYL